MTPINFQFYINITIFWINYHTTNLIYKHSNDTIAIIDILKLKETLEDTNRILNEYNPNTN